MISGAICMISHAATMVAAAGMSGGMPSSAFSAFAFATSDMDFGEKVPKKCRERASGIAKRVG